MAGIESREEALRRTGGDESVIRLHINLSIGDQRLGAVMQPRVQALVNIWTAKSKPRTVQRQYDTLSAIFAAAVDGDLIAALTLSQD